MAMKKRLMLILSLIIVFVCGCSVRENDVHLTKRIFYSLCKGKQSIEALIDWETFKAVGVDVGTTYSSLISEKEQRDYKEAFFYNFSHAFESAGGKTSNFVNWRIFQEDDNNTVIAVDTASGKVLLFTLSIKDGKKKLSAIQWQ